MNEQSYTDTFYKVYRIYQFILMFHGMKDSMKKRDWQNTTRIIMLRLLLLSCFSHVWLCATPQMATHQVPLSLGFSRQEYWSGWPFLSPMQACMLSLFSHARLYATTRTAAHSQTPPSMGLPRQEYWSGLPFPSPTYYYIILQIKTSETFQSKEICLRKIY